MVVHALRGQRAISSAFPVLAMLYESPVAGHDKITARVDSANDGTKGKDRVFIASLLLTTAVAADSPPGSIPLTPTTEVRFASVEEGRAILAANDAFTLSLSRFDLQCRLKTDKEVSLDDWKQFVAQQV